MRKDAPKTATACETHMPTTTYDLFAIEPPVSPAQLTAYKTIRLTALQTDPAAFSSTYARESAFAESVWRQRLDSPLKQVLVASVRPDPSVGGTGEWVGTAWIMGPSGMPAVELASFREAGVGADWEMYGLFGMWVHPAHRGKGVGAQLVGACLDWARTYVDPNRIAGPCVEKVVVLLVRDDNVAARKLYSRTGFTELEDVPSHTEGQRWMIARV